MARQNEIRRELEGQSWVDTGVELIKYIDDYIGIEKINTSGGITTMSCSRQKIIMRLSLRESSVECVIKQPL